MKTNISLFVILFCFLTLGCIKDTPPNTKPPDDEIDIKIDPNKYYKTEIVPKQYMGLYNQWRLDEISGGQDGSGYIPDFDQLVIEGVGVFKFYRNDSLQAYGKIEIKNETDKGLSVSFVVDSVIGKINLYDMDKYAIINDSILTLQAPCCDRYSYLFSSCSVYSNKIYYQEKPQNDNVSITQFRVTEGKYFKSICFTDIDNGYLLTTDNTIFKTTNGGSSWKEDSTGTSVPLNSIYFINTDIGFIVGGESGCNGTGCKPNGSIILKTTNGGLTWIKQNVPAKGELYSIAFIDNNIGFAVGKGLMVKTINGGASWDEFSLDNAGVMEKVFFLDKKIGFMCGLFNNLFKTNDGGESWTNLKEQYVSEIRHFENIQFVDENIGYLSTTNSKLLKTTDGGLSFVELPNSPTNISSFYFKNENEGLVFGNRFYSSGNCKVWKSTIHSTIDGGNKWKGDNKVARIEQISVLSKTIYYGITYNGIVKIEIRYVDTIAILLNGDCLKN